MEPAGKPEPAKDQKDISFWDVATKVLAAILGGITVASFVAVTGGAVHWTRFDAAGLPADPAVSLVGRRELLVTGLSTLVPFLAAAALAVFIVYVIDPTAEITPESERKGKPRRSPRKRWPAETRYSRWLAHTKFAERAREFWIGVKHSWVRVAIFVGLEMIFFYAVTRSLDLMLNAIAWTVALVGALLTFGLAAHTKGFRKFAIAAFIAFAVFGAVVSQVRTIQSPKVRPAAVLMKDGKGLSGIYVAQTDDRVYLGSLTSDALGHREVHPECEGREDEAAEPNEFNAPPRAGRIFSVLRAETMALSIGRLQSPCDALERGPVLVDDLAGRYGKRKLNAWLNGYRRVSVRDRAMTVYRVYGGASAREGKWATTDQLARSDADLARARLALPGENTAACVVTVRIRPPSQIRIGHVAPALGQPGGGTQIEFLGKLTRVRYESDRPLPPSGGPCP